MWILVLAAFKTAAIQIGLSLLSSAFIKEIIIKALKWFVTKTDTHVDDDIVQLVDDALHGRLEDKNTSIEQPSESSSESNSPKICPKCKAVLD